MADSDDSGGTTRRRWPVLLGVLGVIAVLIAVAGMFGGLKAQPTGPTKTSAGHTVNQGPFDVQIMDARSGRIKLGEFDDPANLLIVRMRVTDLGDQSYGVDSFIHGIDAEPRPGAYVAPDVMNSEGLIDGEATSEIHPRLPVVLQVVWTLGKATAPSRLAVALRTWTYDQSFTTDEIYWSVTKQSPVKAEVSVPVRLGATS